VSYLNQTTGATGTASGTTTWSAGVALQPGNNVVLFTANAESAGSASATITVNYNTNAYQTGFDSTEQQTWISQGSPSKNYGSVNSEVVVGYGLPVTPDGGNMRGLIQFAIPTVWPGATINSATLELSGLDPYPNNASPLTITFYPMSGSWSQNSVTWNNVPGFNSSYSPQVTVNSNYLAAPYDIDVTAIVKAWINGTLANNGLMLVSSAENSGVANSRNFRFIREVRVWNDEGRRV
jgi:hypothetical protein